MPDYDFRCEDCDRRLLLRWRRVADYAAATPVCPHCGGDYASMSSGGMLSVLEGEDPGEAQELQRQVHQGADQG